MLRLAATRTPVVAHHRYVASSLIAMRHCHGNDAPSIRTNELGIQMLSQELHSQIFKKPPVKAPRSKLVDVEKHLKTHNLWNKSNTVQENVRFKIPKMQGENLDEHFRQIADDINRPYLDLVTMLLTFPIHKPPKKWVLTAGWTYYDPATGKSKAVASPTCKAMVFDVEVLMTDGEFPTMATAVGEDGWYSWCSRRVVDEEYRSNSTEQGLDDFINLKNGNLTAGDLRGEPPVLVVGHNVGFDRSFIREQYCITHTQTRFLDTMAMHIAVAGLTSMQRVLYMGSKKEDGGMGQKAVREYTENAKQRRTMPTFRWTTESSMNNLRDVHALYCGDEARLIKSTRDVFVKGTMDDVRNEYQTLMSYCATDVAATLSVFRTLWPQFRERLQHPVTLAGMLEMGSTYLPINQNWRKYVQSCQETSQRFDTEQRDMLMKLAEEARVMPEEQYKKDLWLWDLEWKMKQRTFHPNHVLVDSTPVSENQSKTVKKNGKSKEIKDSVTKAKANKIRVPTWYAELCPGPKEFDEYPPGPSKISTLRRTTPKLLRLTWNKYPLHYHETYKWGYLVPEETLTQCKVEKYAQIFSESDENDIVESQELLDTNEDQLSNFPINTFIEHCKSIPISNDSSEISDPIIKKILDLEEEIKSIEKWLAETMDESSMKRALHTLDNKTKSLEKSVKRAVKKIENDNSGDGALDIGIPGVRFLRLPHKDGPTNPVGNPLAKDFLQRIEDGTLESAGGLMINKILGHTKTVSYWKMNKKRILSQRAIRLSEQYLPESIRSAVDYEANSSSYVGAILPQLCTAGTVTRRAVEPTWLTASNAYVDRVGSELKAMVQSPPGYCFVGADVDSQELWIAALIGDSHFGGVHGCTAFGWMTLQGNKADGTDLHSKTASLVGISRDQAKVFNYGRIYGAGVSFAATLLKQFNPSLSHDDARAKARAMYKATKGSKRRVRPYETPRSVLAENDDWDPLSVPDPEENDTEAEIAYEPWQGGTESAMFNKLEKIAMMQKPRTPVLECSISKVLEPHNVQNEFMTSRINWVVQSSGVDYLHLLLVCMKWLCNTYDIDARFSISIHDEVRYLVTKEDRYRLALALQISNLYTRSLFAYKLGMQDLPQSVAFFSAVDIDSCMRKEVFMDCKTPSNELGMEKGYGIPPGEALTIQQVLEKTDASLELTRQPSHDHKEQSAKRV